MALLETHALDVSVGSTTVCHGLDLAITAGSRWGLLGRNGSGKTTLLHTLAGLRPHQGGEIRLDGRPLEAWPRRSRAQRLGVLLQDHHDPFPATVLETVMTGRHPHLRPWQWEGSTDLAIAARALAQVGMAGTEARSVDTLSGGERRRIGIATLLAQAPDLALLDEPTNHLDLHHQVTMLQQLHTADDRRTLCLSLHDINLAARFCDHLLLLLGDGETMAGPAADLLDPELLTRLYDHPVRCVATPDGDRFFPG